MKVRTLITSASVTLALVVPVAANAQVLEATSQQRMVPAKPATTTHKRDAATIKALAKQNKVLQVKLQNLESRLSVAEWRLANVGNDKPAVPSKQVDPADQNHRDCIDQMVNCTPEDACNIWGLDCHLVPAVVPTPAEQSPAVAPVAEVSVTVSSQDTGALPELSPAEIALGSGEESC